MNLQPQLLLHPNIPKPLHGVAPRIIKGNEWWNLQRKIAYLKNDYNCWACGVNKENAKYHKWLEAHEIYHINYLIGEVKFIGICALCHCCHNFIHSGKLLHMFNKKQIDLEKISYILEYGFNILINNKMKINPFALMVALKVNKMLFKKFKGYDVCNYGLCLAKWNDWYMLIDNKKYKGNFKTFDEWKEFYIK